ncbi:hypothetical protein D3C73_1379720 [compost metagenome]
MGIVQNRDHSGDKFYRQVGVDSGNRRLGRRGDNGGYRDFFRDFDAWSAYRFSAAGGGISAGAGAARRIHAAAGTVVQRELSCHYRQHPSSV